MTPAEDAQPPSAPAPAVSVPPAAPHPINVVAAGVTVKSVIFGLIGVMILSLYTGFNDDVLHLPLFIGNHFPIGPLTLVLSLAFAWNPLVGRVFPRLTMQPGELVVILAMMLMSSWIPSSGLFRYFHRVLIVPWLVESQHPLWVQNQVLEYLPAHLFPLHHDPHDPRYEVVYGSFAQGIPRGDAQLALTDAPFRDWLPAVGWWFALLVCVSATMIGLARLVHRQWSHHEHLSYPLAQVTASLLARKPGKLTVAILHERLFWGGAIPVFSLYMLNFAATYWPSKVPLVKLDWWCWGELTGLFPSLVHAIFPINHGGILFTVIGMTYFIATDVSLSMGLSALAMSILSAQYYIATGTPMSTDDGDCLRAGGYIAYFFLLLYTGRGYYLRIIGSALRPLSGLDADTRPACWAARVVIAAFSATVMILTFGIGLDWFIAIIYASSLVIFFLVFTRIICETGIPFLQANFDTGTMITNILGLPAIGPGPLVIIQYLGNILNPDPRECLMPYVATSLRVGENIGINLWKMIGVSFLAMLVALAVGFTAWTYNLYNHGAASDGYAFASLPIFPIDNAAKGIVAMKDNSQFDQSAATHGLGKLGLIAENVGHGRALGWMASGIVAVMFLAVMRFRFPFWPLHPVIILVMNAYPVNTTYFSFLVGWAVKSLIVKLGGGRNYEMLKPFFIGLIVGEIAAVAVVMILGLLHYAIFHTLPKSPTIMPG